MFGKDLDEESTLRRRIETLYPIKRADGCITGIVPIGLVDAKVWYTVAYGLDVLCTKGMTIEDHKEYLRRREFPDPEGEPLVDDEKIYITKKAAVVPVRSRSEWKKKVYHKVEIRNIPKRDALDHEKYIMLRHLEVHCSCGSSIRYIMYPFGSKQLPDGRYPYIDSEIDLHGSLAILHLSLTRNFWDIDIFGFDPISISVIHLVWKRQMKHKEKIDNDVLNSYILRVAKRQFEPLERRLLLKY